MSSLIPYALGPRGGHRRDCRFTSVEARTADPRRNRCAEPTSRFGALVRLHGEGAMHLRSRDGGSASWMHTHATPSPRHRLVISRSSLPATRSLASISRSTGPVPMRVPSGSRWKHASDALLAKAARQLDDYLQGARSSFDLPLETHGDAFQERIWALIREIPLVKRRPTGSWRRSMGIERWLARLARRLGATRFR